jgi:phage terminase large subunit-like protein
VLNARINKKRLAELDARTQDVVVGALRELEQKAKQDPLAFYFPSPKQDIFHAFDAPIRCLFAGNQAGKTTAGLADDLIQALDEDDIPKHLRKYKRWQPPFLCRIMAPSFSVLEITLYQKLQELLPTHTLIGESWSKAYNRDTRVLHFKNGSKFFFGTYEQEPAKLQGATLHRIHYDEEPPEDIRNECRIRVMRQNGEEVFTMTPTAGLMFAYEKLWEQRGEEVAPGVFHGEHLQIVTASMDDNPTLSDEAKEIALAGLSAEERAARKEGKFVALHGLIYDRFDPERHIIPEVERPPLGVNVVVGIDPGIRERAGVLWAFIDWDDTLVVFDELYAQGATIREVCEQIHKVNARYDIKPIYYVIDPAARNRMHQTGRSDQMEYADHGVVAIAGQNSVSAGINRIKERLEADDGFYITANCENLIGEMKRYRWKKPPRSGEDGKAAPVKKDDHLVDPLRYIVMSRPYLPRRIQERNETNLQRIMREHQERVIGEGKIDTDTFVGQSA